MAAPAVPPLRGRVCVLDVDGTLLTSRHTVASTTARALAGARARGIRVLLASSRGPAALQWALAAAGTRAADPYVASQGAVVGRYSPSGAADLLVQHPMPLAGALTMVARAARLGIAASWYAGGDWLVSHLDATVEREAEIVRASPVVADLTARTVPPEKLMFVAPSGDPAEVAALAQGLPEGLRAQVSNPTYLEVTATGVDKAQAVRRWCETAGLAARDVVAVGDGPNDLGMLAFAGTAVAPANARPEVLAAADVIVPSNDEDGVAVALDAMALPA